MITKVFVYMIFILFIIYMFSIVWKNIFIQIGIRYLISKREYISNDTLINKRDKKRYIKNIDILIDISDNFSILEHIIGFFMAKKNGLINNNNDTTDDKLLDNIISNYIKFMACSSLMLFVFLILFYIILSVLNFILNMFNKSINIIKNLHIYGYQYINLNINNHMM
ncbi:hypothetical protein EPJ79_07245 [Brachyspira aalborgi]|uniref:Uncharacterized protein n=1 Tax=Brachyspira aalborgi TaxID=29522 RepID=A0A5C8D6T1_9SPIR|nr:hypothetical protein [Brachyspira aalborgi]TXJ20916.1 hypothetical protein EPJ79_07245 [Brachyspira aalborgi]